MNDLEFLLLSKYIFENKSVEYQFCSQMIHVKDWLNSIDSEKLDLNSNFKNFNREIILDLKLEHMDRIIDLLNICNPSITIKIIINNENDNLLSKRLNMKSHSRLTFDVNEKLEFFKPGHIHGGDITINGDVESVDLVSVLKAAPVPVIMRTSIHINGSIQNSKSFCETIFDYLREIVQKTEDSFMHGFSLNIYENIDDLVIKKTKTIRNWEIVCESNSKKIQISVSKI